MALPAEQMVVAPYGDRGHNDPNAVDVRRGALSANLVG
jgi:hypothetical protein